MTEKLFYEDSHISIFSAVVMLCEKTGDDYEAVLDRTAFFPEGGGQYADTGVIDGKKVLDVKERQGIIYHKMHEPLEVGKTVNGIIEWEERFSKMQHHSGEHIVSGLVHQLFGYDNVGFHMGKDAVTMDFNGVITREQLKAIERKANETVVKNIDIEVLYPSEEELKSIDYRSKIEIAGQVRIVVIPEIDICACCAPHVKKTGEIGLIKLIGLQNYKGGVRVSMLCGFRAIADYEEKSNSVKTISVMLSAKEKDITEEVQRLKDEIATRKANLFSVQHKLLSYKVRELKDELDIAILFETEAEGSIARELVNMVLQEKAKTAAVFVGNEKDGYRYVIGSKEKDTRIFAKILNEKFQGRGGGKPEMVQGSLLGSENEIREEVITCNKKV